jgi:hypothetical protein
LATSKSNGSADGAGPASSQKVSVGRQVLRRELNDRVWARDGRSELALKVFCECGRAGCRDSVVVTLDVYETLRRVPTHFLIKHSHAEAGERVVESFEDFLIVEKFGPSGLEAIQLERAKHHLSSGSE